MKGALFPWVRMAFVHPIGEMLELAAGKSTKHAKLIAWYKRIGQREAVLRGLLIPEANPPEVQWRYLLMRLWDWVSCISSDE